MRFLRLLPRGSHSLVYVDQFHRSFSCNPGIEARRPPTIRQGLPCCTGFLSPSVDPCSCLACGTGTRIARATRMAAPASLVRVLSFCANDLTSWLTGAARSGSGSLDAAASAAAAREAAAAAREDVEGAAESMRARNGREVSPCGCVCCCGVCARFPALRQSELTAILCLDACVFAAQEGDDEPASASSRDQKQPSPQPELKQQPQQSQLSEEEDRALELREQNFFAPCDLGMIVSLPSASGG